MATENNWIRFGKICTVLGLTLVAIALLDAFAPISQERGPAWIFATGIAGAILLLISFAAKKAGKA
jgi:uncharacterized membrane protein YdcZ (DUF606 family)